MTYSESLKKTSDSLKSLGFIPKNAAGDELDGFTFSMAAQALEEFVTDDKADNKDY